jgi:hypothetical protein
MRRRRRGDRLRDLDGHPARVEPDEPRSRALRSPGRERRRSCAGEAKEDTDWAEIVRLYDRLERIQPTAIVALNRAVAVAMVDGPRAALALVDALEEDGALDG